MFSLKRFWRGHKSSDLQNIVELCGQKTMFMQNSEIKMFLFCLNKAFYFHHFNKKLINPILWAGSTNFAFLSSRYWDGATKLKFWALLFFTMIFLYLQNIVDDFIVFYFGLP